MSTKLPTLKKDTRNAIMLAVTCFIAYLSVYFLRGIFGAVSPQMETAGIFSPEEIGLFGSAFFVFYAIGQLCNGIIGDHIKAKYMMSAGLLLSGVFHIVFVPLVDSVWLSVLSYAMTGLVLSMVYAPMTKVVSESLSLHYAQRCSIAYSFAASVGTPLAGLCAAIMTWKASFYSSGALLVLVGLGVFIFFIFAEKNKIVSYNNFARPKEKGGSLKILFERQIVKFTLVSVITGIIRTSVVFFLPSYFCKFLGFSESNSALLFTVATLLISFSVFLSAFVFELLKKDMNKALLLFFITSAITFAGAFLFRQPIVNVIMMIIAITMSYCAANMLWSYYCPSLRDTGLVSSATGFLDFMSYLAAAIANLLSPYAVSAVGWSGLLLIWTALVGIGFICCLPLRKKK